MPAHLEPAWLSADRTNWDRTYGGLLNKWKNINKNFPILSIRIICTDRTTTSSTASASKCSSARAADCKSWTHTLRVAGREPCPPPYTCCLSRSLPLCLSAALTRSTRYTSQRSECNLTYCVTCEWNDIITSCRVNYNVIDYPHSYHFIGQVSFTWASFTPSDWDTITKNFINLKT